MKKIISLSVLMLLIIPAFAQDSLKVNISYDAMDKRLYVEIENKGWERVGLFNGPAILEEYSGCVINISEKEENSFYLNQQFPMLEYDKNTKTYKPYPAIYVIEPHSKKTFSLNIGAMEQYKQTKTLFINVLLQIGAGKEMRRTTYKQQINL